MVALRQLLPEEPHDRDLANTLLESHPELADFIVQFSRQVLETRADAEVHLDARQFDEWDPPLTMVIREPFHQDDYIGRYRELLTLARKTPGYDRALIHVSLQPSPQMTSTTQ